MSMSWLQDMNTSTTIPNIESMATLYGNNQPVDPNLLDGFFSPTSIFGINESLSKDSRNIALSLQRIRMFIKQCSIKSSSKALVSLDYKPVIMSIWQLINSVYKSEWEYFTINDEQSFLFNKKIIIWFTPKSKPTVLEKTSESTPLVTNPLLPVSALLSKIVSSSHIQKITISSPDINVNLISKKAPKLSNAKKSYAQTSKANISLNVEDVLYIKEVFPTLLADKVTRIIKVKNSSKEQKKSKINMMIKRPSRKQIIIPMVRSNAKLIINSAN